ncbi:EAL domain-containing protein [Methyloversatilis thermotolerans]|uniref:EAL domain-containing protein n=1 Tax=Methyloversatilis thermotolerans TaxID=1346290 RepID=UPI000362455D|nr:EAL domain-containing protein [Methyloversatilis thermotolerans]
MNSLRVRLLAALIGVGVVAFAAALATALWVSRDRVEAQMASQAQSIALSLTVALTAGGEPALQNAESLVEPVFDQSYLRRIEVRDARGRVVASRQAAARLPGGAPQWFADLLPLAAGAQTSDILHGWRIAGSVTVEPHPHWAQLQLWAVAETLLLWMGGGLAAASVLGMLALRWGLRPLKRVQRSAVAAASRKFRPIDEHRMPRELQPLVSAFNRMLESLAQALEGEATRAARFRDLALVDELTGLANRRGFRAALEARIEAGRSDGWLALLRVEGLEDLNHLYGREAVDDLLVESTAFMRQIEGSALCGRVEGSCFAMLLDRDIDHARSTLTALLARLNGLASAAGAGQAQAWRIGAADCAGEANADVGRWLAAADRALHGWRVEAGSEPVFEHARAQEAGAGTLRNQVRELIGAGRIVFAAQTTHALSLNDGVACVGAPLHRELRAALDGGGRLIRAAEYMSYAGEARVAAALDSACLVRALDVMRQQRDRMATVINLGAAALGDEGIRRWIAGYRQDARGGTVVLEFPEAVLLSDVEAAETLAQQAHARGLVLGIKHFGLHANALTLLRRVRPGHVKFSLTLTREALLNPDSGAYVRSLAGIASALSITPVAIAVESLSDLQALYELGMRGVQGAAVAPEQMLAAGTRS